MAAGVIDDDKHGLRNLDEGIADAVHNPVVIILGETLDPSRSDVGGAWRRFPPWGQRVGVDLVWGTSDR